MITFLVIYFLVLIYRSIKKECDIMNEMDR